MGKDIRKSDITATIPAEENPQLSIPVELFDFADSNLA